MTGAPKKNRAALGLHHDFSDPADLIYSVAAPRNANQKKRIAIQSAVCPEKARAVEEILNSLEHDSRALPPESPQPCTSFSDTPAQ